jgi:hypothetical protein
MPNPPYNNHSCNYLKIISNIKYIDPGIKGVRCKYSFHQNCSVNYRVYPKIITEEIIWMRKVASTRVAVLALARKLLVIIYTMLKTG